MYVQVTYNIGVARHQQAAPSILERWLRCLIWRRRPPFTRALRFVALFVHNIE